jgi:hypothetical protein
LVDLSSLERGYRIFSFIMLGAILLVVSYFYQRSQQRAAVKESWVFRSLSFGVRRPVAALDSFWLLAVPKHSDLEPDYLLAERNGKRPQRCSLTVVMATERQ